MISLIANFQGTWSNSIQYAVQQLLGVEPLSYLSPTVVYNSNVYIANYNNGQNPPIGVTPNTSSSWTLFSTQSGESGDITSITSVNNTLVVTNPTGPIVDLKINNHSAPTINSSVPLSAASNFYTVGTTGLTLTLPLSSTVTPLEDYTISNLNIAVTSVIPGGSDLLNGGSSAININGAYNADIFYYNATAGMWLVR